MLDDWTVFFLRKKEKGFEEWDGKKWAIRRTKEFVLNIFLFVRRYVINSYY